jgi:hypothetical protein
MNGKEYFPVFAEPNMDSSPSFYLVTLIVVTNGINVTVLLICELGATPVSLNVGSEVLKYEGLLKYM